MLERSAKLLTPKGGDILYSTCSLSPVENDLVRRVEIRQIRQIQKIQSPRLGGP